MDGRTDVRMHVRTYVRMDRRIFETSFIRLTLKSQPKKLKRSLVASYDIQPGNGIGLFS